MTACELVTSEIIHVRHAAPSSNASGKGRHVSHKLTRKGLSIWIDLDRLDDADQQSALFSVGRFNLLSFHERDYGPNFKQAGPVQPLSQYARAMAAELLPDVTISGVKLLTFPRILGVSFNPISVYVLSDERRDVAVIYEVRNTFGDMHSYVGVIDPNNETVHHADKRLHVSPFFSMDGGYRLKIRERGNDLTLIIDYHDNKIPLLTATLRGVKSALSTSAIVKGFAATRMFPLRPLLSIHFEALKLWLKRVQFFGRPAPDPHAWSMAKTQPQPIKEVMKEDC